MVYGDLLASSTVDQIDIKAPAEKHQTSPQTVGARLKNLKTGPNIYQELLRAGYTEQAIPAWVHRGGSLNQPSARVNQSDTERSRLNQVKAPE